MMERVAKYYARETAMSRGRQNKYASLYGTRLRDIRISSSHRNWRWELLSTSPQV